MAATIEYKPIANGGGANVESQLQYETDLGPGGVLQDGYEAGTAESAKVNKTLRQSSVMTAALATAISTLLGGINILDDGDVAALATKLSLAMTGSAWTTGDVKLTLKVVADAGWVMCDDGTIGSAASTATHASDANHALFVFIWTNVIDAWAPVVGGRGGSAELDWAANKKITMTKMLGRALAISGAGAGLTARALGENLGSQDAVVVAHNHGGNTGGQSADHSHPIPAQDISDSGGGAPPRWTSGGGFNTGGSSNDHTHPISSDGVSGVGKNMQPTGFLNAMIKQ